MSGIIAATRDNELGVNGVTNSAQIMVLKVVPNGDERDKDVANAIMYAVNNGAQIINMSFGKLYSWDKKAVDKALKYAQKKGVLMVHAAGNNSADNDKIDHYPVEKFEKKKLCGKKRANNWIEVGALNFRQGQDFRNNLFALFWCQILPLPFVGSRCVIGVFVGIVHVREMFAMNKKQ